MPSDAAEITSSPSTDWSLSRSPNTIHPWSQDTASQLLPPELAQTVTLKLVVTAVLRATCIDETKSFIADVCRAFVVNESSAGMAIDNRSAVKPTAIINSISVNPREEAILACAQTRLFLT